MKALSSGANLIFGLTKLTMLEFIYYWEMLLDDIVAFWTRRRACAVQDVAGGFVPMNFL